MKSTDPICLNSEPTENLYIERMVKSLKDPAILGLLSKQYWNSMGSKTILGDARLVGPVASAFDVQVAGNHYKGMKIQPMEYALANNLGYCEATALKYISRWKLKGGLADIDKAIHFLQLLKEYATKHPEQFGLEENKNGNS